ncbi:CHASE4 domain-containing protein, partial [Pantoea piersonii]|uniref:CHASE4 domain-containing protein n=1 Tax=Pantoea piersonii TaxID=2364647 RepID=UPI001D9BA5E4
MINSAKLSAGFRGSFIREVLLPLAAILLLTLTGAGTGLFLSTSITNQKALAQQQRMIQASFTQSLAEHQRQLHSLSRWTPLEEHLEAVQPDQRWLDDNVGRWLYEMFGHQLIMVLDDARRPVQAWRDGALLSSPGGGPPGKGGLGH